MAHLDRPPRPRFVHAPTDHQLKVGAAGKATGMAPRSVCDARDSIGQAPQRHGNHGLGWRGSGGRRVQVVVESSSTHTTSKPRLQKPLRMGRPEITFTEHDRRRRWTQALVWCNIQQFALRVRCRWGQYYTVQDIPRLEISAAANEGARENVLKISIQELRARLAAGHHIKYGQGSCGGAVEVSVEVQGDVLRLLSGGSWLTSSSPCSTVRLRLFLHVRHPAFRLSVSSRPCPSPSPSPFSFSFSFSFSVSFPFLLPGSALALVLSSPGHCSNADADH